MFANKINRSRQKPAPTPGRRRSGTGSRNNRLKDSFRRHRVQPLHSGRGGGRLLKRLAAAVLALILLLGGGAWLGGRLMLNRLAEALQLDRTAEIRAGLVLALPLVDLAYGRNLTVQLRDQQPPVTVSLKSFRGFPQKNADGGRLWRLDLTGLKFEHGSRALAAARLSAGGRYDRAGGLVELTDGSLDYLVLSAGRTAMTSFTRLSFQSLSFDIRAARLALGRSEAGGSPLDLFWKLEEARLENFKIGLAALDGYETAPLNVRLTARNSEKQWALALDMTGVQAAAEASGSGRLQFRSQTGFLNRPDIGSLDLPRLLRFDRLSLHGDGNWDDGRFHAEGVFIFPRLFSLGFRGLGPAADRARAAEWLGGCFQGRTGDDGPRCLSALPFNGFSVDYGDRGLSPIAKTIKPFQKKIFDETDPSGPLGLPALGLALGLWLNENRPGIPAGRFDFPAEESFRFPFRREFFAALLEGKLEAPFTAPAAPTNP